MPTKLALILLTLAATALVLRNDGDDEVVSQVSVPMEQGLHRFDAVLQKGLSEDTHQAISSRLSGSLDPSVKLIREAGSTMRGIPE